MKHDRLTDKEKKAIEEQYPGHTVAMGPKGVIEITPKGWSTEQVREAAERDRRARASEAMTQRVEALDILENSAA